ncbi:hypothetical protein JMUB7543_28370 [Staphylococcus aureus]
MSASLVGSEMCIRDRILTALNKTPILPKIINFEYKLESMLYSKETIINVIG